MDLEALLEPRDGESVSGENLEYDPEFVAMEIASRLGQERQAGEAILEAEDPDWRDVQSKALAVMARSHDLRAGVTLAGAKLFIGGVSGFAEATAYVRGCLERHWDTCHPQLDAEDDDDPTMRINALQGLAAPDPILRGLRTAPLTDSRTFGRLNLRDVLLSAGHVTANDDEEAVDAATVAAAFRDTDPERLAQIAAGARGALEHVRAIEQLFVERTPGQGPQLAETARLLQQMIQHLPGAPEPEADSVPDAAAAPEGAAPAGAVAGGGAPGQIASQADVRAALDAIIAYYRRSEPSSPVPLLLERAKRLVGADFLAVVSDLAPGGIDNVRHVGGLGDDD